MTVRPPVPAIDVHTHLFPDRLMTAVRRALGEMYGWSFDLPTEPRSFADFVRQRGTETFCILPYAHKPGMAQSLNEWVANTAADLGAIGFACVHPDDDAEAILDEAFANGLRGVKLHYQVQNVAPNDPRWEPVYRLMVERDMPLLVHAGRGPTDSGTVGIDVFRPVIQRHPGMRVCVAHLGWPERDAFLDLAREYPSVYLDTSGIGNGSIADVDLRGLDDRLLFGTDAPNIPFDYDLTVQRILELGLGDDTNEKVFRGNAKRFLKL